MAKINFYLQSLLMGTALILGIVSLTNRHLVINFMLLQTFVGFIQYVAAWIYLALRGRFKLLDIYLLLATSVLGLIWISYQVHAPAFIIIFLVFVAPWLLAIYYWCISFRLLKGEL